MTFANVLKTSRETMKAYFLIAIPKKKIDLIVVSLVYLVIAEQDVKFNFRWHTAV